MTTRRAFMQIAAAAAAPVSLGGMLSMPPFRKTEISDAELAAVAACVAGRYQKP